MLGFQALGKHNNCIIINSLNCSPCNFYIYIYIYAFSRRFYPKRLTVHSGYTFIFVSTFDKVQLLHYIPSILKLYKSAVGVVIFVLLQTNTIINNN